MKFTFKRLMAMLLSVMMIVGMLPATVFAEDATETTVVAKIGETKYEDLQDAIVAAAPSGTVEILADVTVDEWVMIAESLTIGNDDLITCVIDGMTIDGNGHTLTIDSIESAGNGGRLFFDATKLNIKDLTIKYADGLDGAIGLKAGTIENVTFEGCTYGVMPQTGDVVITGCTFKTTGTSIYFEEERDGLTVTGCTFENADSANVILLRGDIKFTNNTVVSGRTVNVVSGSPVVTGNDFNDVRLKVYNGATATISKNTINNLVFNDETAPLSTFAENELSTDAQAALNAVKPAPATPTGSLGVMYIEQTDTGRARVYGEATGIYANESVVVKLYYGDTLVGTTTRSGVSFPYESSELTINIVMAGEPSGSWNTVWENGAPSAYAIPDKAELIVDGQVMATVDVKLNGPDGVKKVVAAVTDADGKITKFISNSDFSSNFAAALNTAFAAGGNIVLLRNIEVDTATITVPDGVSVNFDMNGHTITVTDNATTNYELFYIYGELNVTGNGTIELTSTNNREWNAMSAIFHNRGGVLTIENGAFENRGGTDMAWVVDNSGNYYGDATTNINGGTLTSTYTAIRNRMEQNSHGASGTAILNISGGSICGTTSAVWAQAASVSETAPATGEINVSGGNVSLINTARSTGAECMTTISGGTVAGFKGEVGELTVTSTGTAPATITLLTAAGEEVNYIVDEKGVYVEAPAGPVEVTTYEELIAALAEDNANVIMKNDITATATQSSGYGKAGIVLDAGDVLDGNGKTLTINGANATWDCAIAMKGGEVKNLTIAGAMRGVFMPGANGDVVIDSCVFKDVIYTFNSDAGSKDYTVTIKNTTLNGWTSFSNVHKSVTFESCTFGKGSGYAYCRPYQATTFTNCTFTEGFALDTTATVENNLAFNGCTYNGTALSAKNNAMFPDGGKVLIDGVSTDVTNYPPTGSNSYAYTKEVDGYVRVWGEGGGNAKENFMLKLYAEDTLIATTQLNNVGGIIDGDVYVTWNFFYPESDDEYWTTSWEEGHPNAGAQPTKVELYIDGICVATTAAKMSGADDVNPVVWAELGGVAPAVPEVIEIYDWDDLKALDTRVEGGDMLEGVTVKLMNDIDLYEMGADGEPVTFNPIGANKAYFKGTFDGQGHTIKNMYQSGWALGYDWDHYGTIGLFAYIWNATIKNLTIENAECFVEGGNVAGIAGCAWGNCTFENITIKNSTYATYNNRAAGIVGYTGGEGTMTFKDITVDKDTVIAGLWGSFDSSLGGVVGSIQDPTKHVFENVTVACRLDAYNDVTAAYKYYAYRMCGMLIGKIPVDANNQPILDNVTIDNNVKIDYSNTPDYAYTNATGSWKRVEAGYTYGGVDLTQYPDAEVIYKPFNSIFGGQQYGSYGQDDHEEIMILGRVAEFDGEYFTSLETAVKAADGAKDAEGNAIAVKLMADYSDDIVITESLKLDLNGNSFTGEVTTIDGYEVVFEDDVYTVVKSVAQIQGGESYASLQAAIDAANGATVTLIADTTENITIAGDATVVIDLNGKTLNGYIVPCNPASLTISNGSIKNTDAGYSAIEINAGTLTLTNVNVSSARHGVRIDGAVTATINGGVYALTATSGTRHSVNVSGTANVTIIDGTFVGPKGTTMDSGSAVCVQSGANVTIEGGNFSGGKNATLGVSGTMSITGGTFDQDPTAYVADGFKAVNKNGTWTVKEHVVLAGSGTETDPYLITNLKELKAFRDYVNEGNTYADQYVKLTADIDLTNEIWIPIGTSNYDKTPTDANVKMFAGNFDGGKHTITGLTSDGYIPDSAETGSTEYSFGLFGYVYGANISNVKLANVNIDCGTRTDSAGKEVYGSGVAALIGYYFPANEKTSVISNCHVLSGTVKASNNMGGLIGHMDSQLSQPAVDITIENCSNAADVTTEAREAGGILGLMNSAREGNYLVTMRGTVTFKNCVNTGDITSLGGGAPSAGGILGRDHNQAAGQRLKIVFDGCENSGTITVTANGETHAAGIGAGYYSNGAWLIAKNCKNTGNVAVNNPSSKVYAGGLISYGGVVELINSTSTGTVTGGIGNTYVGGAQNILFLEKMDNFTDTVNGYTYYLNGGTSPEYAALVDDAAGGGNFHLVETAYKTGCDFGGWYDNAELTGEAYTALNKNVKTYYAKWIGDEPVAKIGTTTYTSLQDAIDKAQNNDTITVLTDINLADTEINSLAGKYNTYFLVEGKSVTINLNEKTISGAYTGDSMLVGVFSTDNNGHLTLTGNGTVDVTATNTVYGLLVNYEEGCSITVKNGTYKLDKANDSLIYTGGNEGVIINGGTFTLGNVGTGSNGSPWIFNAQGKGENHVLVYGGTFNANVFDQHWRHEVQCDGESTITDNGNGTWTVARDAKAYVIEQEGNYGYEVGYKTFEEALAATAGQNAIGLGLLADATISEKIAIDKNFTIEGNDKTLTYTGSDRAIDVPVTANGADVTIKNLTVVAASAERVINYNTNGTLNVEGVTVTGGSYAINFPSSADNATVSIKDSKLTALIALNVWGSEMTITVTDSELYSLDDSDQFSYAAIQLNNNGNDVANGTIVTVNGGKISALDENNEPSIAVSNWTATGTVNISNTTKVIGELKNAVAMCAGACFYTLQDAIDEVVKYNYNAPVVIIRDIELSEIITVPAGAKITLDLNGKTITGTDNTEKNFSIIDNRGELTITGNGKMTLNAKVNSGWNRYSAVIANNPGGKLTIENGTIEHLGGTDMAYGIDNLTNGKGTYAETIINGGTIKSTYRAIRQFLNGVEAQNILTVNGGTIEGKNKSIWMQDPNVKANVGTLTVGENAKLVGDVYLYVTPGSTEWPVEISIAAAALDGESTVVTGNVPVGYVVENSNGTWGVREANYVAKIGDDAYYEKLAEAITAAKAGDTITLIADITEDVTISKSLTIDGADFKYTGNISVSGNTTAAVVKNVNFVDGTGYAITTNRIKSITVEDCTVNNYGFGFLYANKSTPTVVVKNVTVDGGNYGFHWVYGSNATLENVTMTNVTNGLLIQNYAGKTITLKNCNITSINVWERDSYSGVQTFKFEGANTVATLSASQYAKYVLAAADATLTAPEGDTVTTSVANSMVKYENGTYKVVKAVAKIGEDELFETFVDALNAVEDGETLTLLDVEGSELSKEIDFTKDIEFTITGTAPKYALPVVTFQNATVNIKDAEILIPELDARQNATINVVDSIVHDAGGNSIVKSYYNGAINISGTSVVYTMQVTTMGYITVSDTAELTATWQTNVYGNGMITVEDSAQFNTAALHLTGKDYSGRDNTDADRVGKPAQITVDGATLIIGKAFSDGGADYSYNSSKGINIGTIAGKKAVLDIKNGAKVNIYMTDGQTANIGADGTVNVDGELTVACRKVDGTATLTNNGSIVMTTVASVVTANECGNVTTTVDGYEVKYADGKYTVSEKIASATIKATSATLLYNDMIQIRYKFAVTGDDIAKYGMLVFANKTDADALDASKAVQKKELEYKVIDSSAGYFGYTDGIAAKEMGDSQFVVGYVELNDGTTVYSNIVEYSPKIYARNMVGKETTKAETKVLCNALMAYGAAAQKYLKYKTNDLMNEGFEPVVYDASVLGESIFNVDTNPTNGFTTKAATLLFEGAITYRIKYTASSEISDKPLYLEYTVKGETSTVEMKLIDGAYYGYIAGIAAKDMDEKLTAKPFYLDESGDRVYGAELVYSGYEYARRTATSSNENSAALAKAFAMYVSAADVAISK